MNLSLLVLAFFGPFCAPPVKADSPPMAHSHAAAADRMFVEPSSSSVSLGRANLVVSPLSYDQHSYIGKYQLKVTPYFFKNEKGTLLLVAPEDSVKKLAGGNAVEFTGKATNAGNGKTKAITGKITPATSEHGAVTFSVTTENGPMVFNTSYHFEP